MVTKEPIYGHVLRIPVHVNMRAVSRRTEPYFRLSGTDYRPNQPYCYVCRVLFVILIKVFWALTRGYHTQFWQYFGPKIHENRYF